MGREGWVGCQMLARAHLACPPPSPSPAPSYPLPPSSTSSQYEYYSPLTPDRIYPDVRPPSAYWFWTHWIGWRWLVLFVPGAPAELPIGSQERIWPSGICSSALGRFHAGLIRPYSTPEAVPQRALSRCPAPRERCDACGFASRSGFQPTIDTASPSTICVDARAHIQRAVIFTPSDG